MFDMWWVYILQNDTNGAYYTGCTQDPEARVKAHNVKRKRKWSGRQKGKWILVYKEFFGCKRNALIREKEIKRKKSRIYIKHLIENCKNGSGPSISMA